MGFDFFNILLKRRDCNVKGCLPRFVCVQVGDEESREQLIKDHYMARVAELTSQLQVSDSKAVHFHAEVSQAGLLLCCLQREVTPCQVKMIPDRQPIRGGWRPHDFLHLVTSSD